MTESPKQHQNICLRLFKCFKNKEINEIMETDLKEDIRSIQNSLALTTWYSWIYPRLWVTDSNCFPAAELCPTPSAGPLLSSELLWSTVFCCWRFYYIQGEGSLVGRLTPWYSGLVTPRCLLSQIASGECSCNRYRNWALGVGSRSSPRSDVEIAFK